MIFLLMKNNFNINGIGYENTTNTQYIMDYIKASYFNTFSSNDSI